VHDAEDLTQQFLSDLLERGGLDSVDPAKGRFRSFLLASLNHFLANEHDRRTAAKRGGGQLHLSLSDSAVEAAYLAERADHLSPELLYDRQWALAVLECVHERLQQELNAFGNNDRVEALSAFLPGRDTPFTHAEVASRLNMSEGSVKVEVHRLRVRFRRLLRQEIAATVQSADEIDHELRYLIESLTRG